MPFRINNAITTAQMLYNLDHCANITVGDEKYQFYCQTKTNLDGSCTTIPSQYLTNGLNCPVMASDAWLDKVYAETGLNCGINCYYYGYGIPPINIPTINIPTINVPTNYYTTDYYTTSKTASPAAGSTPIPTYDPIPVVPVANSSSVSSVSSSLSSTSPAGNSIPTIGAAGSISSAKNLSPNILLLAVLLVSVMALFRRIQ